MLPQVSGSLGLPGMSPQKGITNCSHRRQCWSQGRSGTRWMKRCEWLDLKFLNLSLLISETGTGAVPTPRGHKANTWLHLGVPRAEDTGWLAPSTS